MQGLLRVGCIAGALLVSGCGTNALRVEYAGNVSAAGTVAEASARDMLRRAGASREDARAELAAADPVCISDPIVLRADPVFGAKAPARGSLCREGGVSAGPADKTLKLEAIDRQILPTLGLLKAMTLYTDALGEIADETPVDPAKTLVDAHETAFAAQEALRALFQVEDQPLPGADDPRLTAIFGFVKFLGELAAEAEKVERLREIVKANPDGVDAVLPKLREQLLAWNIARATAGGVALGANQSLLQRVKADPGAMPKDRRDAVMMQIERQRAELKAQQLHPALTQVLDALQKSDRDFRRVLEKNPKLTKEERRKVLEIGRRRLVKALQLVTELANSFRGA